WGCSAVSREPQELYLDLQTEPLSSRCPDISASHMHRVKSKPVARLDAPRHSVTVGVSICLVVFTWIVFSQTLQHDFVNYDDPRYVYQNTRITSGLNMSGIAWAFT